MSTVPAAAFKRATDTGLPASWTTLVDNDGTGLSEVDIYITSCRVVNTSGSNVTLDARVDPASGDTVLVEEGAVVPPGYPLVIRDIALEPGDTFALRAGTAGVLDVYVAYIASRKVL